LSPHLVLDELLAPIFDPPKSSVIDDGYIPSLEPSITSYRIFGRLLVVEIALGKAVLVLMLDRGRRVVDIPS